MAKFDERVDWTKSWAKFQNVEQNNILLLIKGNRNKPKSKIFDKKKFNILSCLLQNQYNILLDLDVNFNEFSIKILKASFFTVIKKWL